MLQLMDSFGNMMRNNKKQTAQGPYAITEQFEQAICDYTGAPFCTVVDCCSHAIFLALMHEVSDWQLNLNEPILIPKHTFPSVPCEIIHAGLKVRFYNNPGNFGIGPSKINSLKGPYQLSPTKVYDSALRFTTEMYMPNTFMCISFTGPRKILKLTKGGAILHDNPKAQEWFKSARMSGRHEKPFLDDEILFAGWDFYIDPEKSSRGLMAIREFYTEDGKPIPNEDVELEYPDLSKMEAFK